MSTSGGPKGMDMRALLQALDEMSEPGTPKLPSASDRERMKPIIKAFKEIEGKERPSKYTHRVEWNDFFERELALKYTCFSYTSSAMETQEKLKWSWAAETMPDLNLTIAQRTKELMEDEGQLAAIALENLAYANFEAKWMQLSLERKKELALDGLYRGSRCSPRENSRVICPELTIAGLVGDGEYNLINLELFLFVHPYVEHEFRHSDEAPDLLKAFLYRSLLYRNFCIVDTLIGILEAFNNLPTPPMIPFKSHNTLHDDERAERRRRAKVEIKKNNLKKTVDGSQCREQKGNITFGCTTCFTKSKPGNLKRCARCQLVWYCSSACQRKDWADHKKFCGKQYFDPQLLAPTPDGPDEFIGCPASVDGYVRTPALWRQIWYLSKPDSQRSFYHLAKTPLQFDTTPKHTRSIVVKHPPGASDVFLVARRRAMASGSIPAIHMMFAIATHGEVDGMTVYDVAVEQMRRQFEMEYRIELTPAAIQAAEPFAPPTQSELKEEREFLRQRLNSLGETLYL
ncbi:hypothetical protein DFH06DRAFT_1428576 [Mycena polygramma]|nr:hypothetical protein DFH06DRAFT_1428576 [Mycena polygramma]